MPGNGKLECTVRIYGKSCEKVRAKEECLGNNENDGFCVSRVQGTGCPTPEKAGVGKIDYGADL